MQYKQHKIMWVAHEANVSGANLCLLEFMQIVKEWNIEQLLVLPHDGNMRAKAEALNAKVVVVPFYPWIRKNKDGFINRTFFKANIRNVIAVNSLMKLIRSQKVSVVFTNTITFNVAAIASKICRRKHYWMVHELGEEDFGFRLPWGKFSYKFMQWTSEKIFCNSLFTASKYSKYINAQKSAVLYNPVFVDNIKNKNQPNLTAEPFRLLMLGQVLNSKGQHLAIEALGILKQKGFDVRLTIVGNTNDTEYKNKLQNLITSNKLGGAVLFKQYSSFPGEEIKMHHVLLMCSYSEAFGRVTVEANKYGVPVIAAHSGGSLEIIEEPVNGLLFENGNVQSLAEAICKMKENYPQVNQALISQRADERFNSTVTGSVLKIMFD